MKNLQTLTYEGKAVRTVTKNGEAWWVLKDVCDILDIKNVTQIAQRLDDYEKAMFDIGLRNGPVNCVNESGLYTVILRSDKEEAIPFRKWVTSAVLPSIRKHGAYMTPEKIEEVLLNPDTIIEIATRLKEEQARRKALESKVKEQHPKVLFADAVETAQTSILIGDLAKLLKQNGIDIGQNRLFDRLRSEDYLCKNGDRYNMPTQKSIDMGLFEVKERTIANPDGSVRITRTPKVTGKGQVYFINRYLPAMQSS